MTIKICVGSTNPVKINAVTLAAAELKNLGAVEVTGVETDTGVSEQPFSDQETRLGAINRARAALQALRGQAQAEKDTTYLGLGLEGGVTEGDDGHLWSTVWSAVAEDNGQVWLANGARVQIPDILAKRLRAGEELGPVVAQLTGLADVRKKQGMFGIVTNNYVTRTEEYSSLAKFALGLWFGQDWQKQLPKE